MAGRYKVLSLLELLKAHRGFFLQKRLFQRARSLAFAESLAFTRHTITQLLLALGKEDQDWSAWYRLFSWGRFPYAQASRELLRQSLAHSRDLFVIATDVTTIPRTGKRMRGAAWLHGCRTRGMPFLPVGFAGVHAGSTGPICFSRALPLWWQPAFTRKAIGGGV